jgi:formamidopyrimidine-DNA glycosylase
MPELPEVETVRRGLEPAMLGQRIARVEQNRADLRFPLPERFIDRLTGRRVEALSRRAKYLIADLDDGAALIMHLGMSGRFIVEAPGTPPLEPGAYYNEVGRHLRHDHVVFHMESGARVTYNDVRRFGFMDLVPRAELAASKHFAGMGIEPLGNELSGETLARLFSGKLARDVLEEAVAAGGSTLRDFAHADGSLGYFQHRFRVYDREGGPCVTAGCGGSVKRLVQSGRSTFYCESCQPKR